MTPYELPDLPYDHGALEPHISARTLLLHHGKHHAAYVKGANTALERLAEARAANDYSRINQLEKDLAFNVSGHVLHDRFWACMSPDGGDRPEGELAAAIDESFGSFDALRSHLTAVTAGVQGSGWGALSWEPLGQCLVVHQVYDHQSNHSQGSTPLLVIDAWEHAYYLDHQNERGQWIEAFWNVAHWAGVAARFDELRGVTAAGRR